MSLNKVQLLLTHGNLFCSSCVVIHFEVMRRIYTSKSVMSEFLASTDNQNFTEINKFKRNELRVREREILQAWCPFHTLSVIYILTDRRPGDVRLQGHS